MTVRKSQQQAVSRYVQKHYDRIGLTIPKGQRDVIKAAADLHGESVNAYIVRAVNAALVTDGLRQQDETDGSR